MAYEFALMSDSEILREFRNGDSQQAALALVRKYQSFVYALAYRFVPDREEALDIAQEAFIKAIRHIHKFREESSLRTWLYSITKNVALSWIKQKKRKNFVSGTQAMVADVKSTEDYEPDKQFAVNELSTLIHHIIAELPEKQREVFLLRYVEELSYEEISAMTGTSIGGLKANFFHAIKKIGDKLREYGYEIPK